MYHGHSTFLCLKCDDICTYHVRGVEAFHWSTNQSTNINSFSFEKIFENSECNYQKSLQKIKW